MMTQSTSMASPSRRDWLARISAVQQMMGAPALMEESPVTMPTLSAPNRRMSSKNFSLTSALRGAV